MSPSRFGPVLLMVLLLLISSAGFAGSLHNGSRRSGPSDQPGESFGPTKAPDDWTIIIYMAGDNSLGDNGSADGNQVWADLNELEAALQGVSGVNIIVLADEAELGDTRCYELAYDDGPGLPSPKINLSDINATWLTELDMGNVQNLIDFTTWAVNSYPADHYMLELWDHGSGVFRRRSESGPDTRYICMDYHGTQITMEKLRTAMKAIYSSTGTVFDVFTMDACLMGMAEIFYEVYPYAEIAVASQEEDPWDGFDYNFIKELKDDPAMDGPTLALHIVDYFYDAYTDGQPDPADEAYITIAAVNLTKMYNAVNTSLDPLANELMKRAYYYSYTGTGELQTVRGGTEEFRDERYIDLLHLLERLLAGNFGPIVDERAQTLWDGLNDSVIESRTGTTNPNANGLSIYFPEFQSLYSSAYNGASNYLTFPKDTLWDEFLNEYYSPSKKCNITLTLQSLDGDELYDDALVTFRQNSGTPLSGAVVYLDGALVGVTDSQGNYSKQDLGAGTHRFELVLNDLVGIVDAIVKNKAPVAGFSVSTASAQEDQLIIFNGSSSTDPENDELQFLWDFDSSDGVEFMDAVGLVVNHSYKHKGAYNVSLMVNDSHSSAYVQKLVQVINIPPVALALNSSLDLVEDQEAVLDGSPSTDTPSDAILLQYMWDYGDGEAGNWSFEPIALHTYPQNGDYTATLYVRDDDGAVGQTQVDLKVRNAAPAAHFELKGTVHNETAKNLSLLENTPYTFDGSASLDTPSDLPGLKMVWNFSLEGNSFVFKTYEGALAQHTFQYKGTWDVSLKVTDDDGAFDLTELRIKIANRAPQPLASANGTVVGYEDELLLFDAGNTTDSLEDIGGLRYLWDFDGDGVFEGAGIQAYHSFPRSGYYLATLKVYDPMNTSAEDSFTVWILNAAPKIALLDNYTVNEDQVLAFGRSDILDSEADIGEMKLAWDLDGDGNLENRSLQVSVSYPRQGTYELNVQATDPEGATAQKSVSIRVVNVAPRALFVNRPGKTGLEMRFQGNKSTDTASDLGSLRYFWDFGDGQSSYEMNPVHEYKRSGTYNVTLSVTDDDGASDSTYVIITIKEEKEPDYLAYLAVVVVIIACLIGIYVLYVVERSREKRRLDASKTVPGEEKGGGPPKVLEKPTGVGRRRRGRRWEEEE